MEMEMYDRPIADAIAHWKAAGKPDEWRTTAILDNGERVEVHIYDDITGSWDEAVMADEDNIIGPGGSCWVVGMWTKPDLRATAGLMRFLHSEYIGKRAEEV